MYWETRSLQGLVDGRCALFTFDPSRAQFVLELDNCIAGSDYEGSGGPAGKNAPGIAEYAKKSLAVPALRMVLLPSIPRVYRLAYDSLYDFFCMYSSQY